MLLTGAPHYAAIAKCEIDPYDVTAERTSTVMIFSVNVSRHHPPNRHVFRTGSDRQEPPMRYKQFDNIGQKRSSLANQEAGLRIEVNQSLEAPHH